MEKERICPKQNDRGKKEGRRHNMTNSFEDPDHEKFLVHTSMLRVMSREHPRKSSGKVTSELLCACQQAKQSHQPIGLVWEGHLENNTYITKQKFEILVNIAGHVNKFTWLEVKE